MGKNYLMYYFKSSFQLLDVSVKYCAKMNNNHIILKS